MKIPQIALITRTELAAIRQAAALELAAPITGLAAGIGMAGIKQCFDDWIDLNGAGKQEDRQIIENAVNFMQQYAHSPRFAGWSSEITSNDHAGYRKTSQTELDEFWIIPKVFEQEILQGKDTLKGCMVLHGIGWLKKSGKRLKMQRFQNGRFYVLSNSIALKQRFIWCNGFGVNLS